MGDHNKLLHSPLYPPLLDSQRHCVWHKLFGSSRSLAIGNFIKNHPCCVLLLTEDQQSAERYVDELRFYVSDQASAICYFPGWEILPYDKFSPHQDITCERFRSLVGLLDKQVKVVVASVDTVMYRLIPRDYLQSTRFSLAVNQQLDVITFKSKLVAQGYRVVGQVVMPGDIAIRGSVIDIYPNGANAPYRLDLFDEQIETIRVFNPKTQCSIKLVNGVTVLPAKEIALSEEHISCFCENWLTYFSDRTQHMQVYDDIRSGIAPPGIENYLPFFYPHTDTLFDYLSSEQIVMIDDGTISAAELSWEKIEKRYQTEQEKSDHRQLLPPADLFIHPEQLIERLADFSQINFSQFHNKDAVVYATAQPEHFHVSAKMDEPLRILKQFIENFAGKILVIAQTAGRLETILELFWHHKLRPKRLDSWQEFITSDVSFAIMVASLQRGLVLADPMIAVITEQQIFSNRANQNVSKEEQSIDAKRMIEALSTFIPGSLVVHQEHGIGRYKELVNLMVGGSENEYMLIEYAQADKLYVPVLSLKLVSLYIGGDPEHVTIHRLGSTHWEKVKRRAAKRAHDVACELLELNARRAMKKGYQFEVDHHAYQQFISRFPFTETSGQTEAINAVIADMQAPTPMDRLVCGDAGFGKTEVALRAAFIATQNGKQVALLVPTTLLAEQHYQHFLDRFSDFPINISLLSRFITKKMQQTTLEKLASGQTDIVIGTHRLFQKDVKFFRMGLVIIDEEHRFGVRQKETFKALRTEVDLLTLTATPIPRTLNMTLSGLKSLSVITTPPLRRVATKTIIQSWNLELLHEAIMREIARGGQIYIIHNDIQTIEKMATQVAGLAPQISVRYAHGKMPEKILESVMVDFIQRHFNVLVCTTIIETGIDVPNANTIIINRADKFGLAQLYQLRGRVGRSHHQAFAYLLTPEYKLLSVDAKKRLEVMAGMDRLSVGFSLATQDLEIRGAGEILGDEQSGQMQEIGFGLYMELLERAVQSIKTGELLNVEQPFGIAIEVNLHVRALLPSDYVPDTNVRLILYKRIAAVSNDSELMILREEIVDRFGPIPDPGKTLFIIAKLKLQAAAFGICKIDLSEEGGRLTFQDMANVDVGRMVKLMQDKPQVYQLTHQNMLVIKEHLPDFTSKLQLLDDIFTHIKIQDAA